MTNAPHSSNYGLTGNWSSPFWSLNFRALGVSRGPFNLRDCKWLCVHFLRGSISIWPHVLQAEFILERAAVEEMKDSVTQSCPGSSIHGIHQARILDSRDHVFQSFDFTWITLKVSLLWSGWLTTQFYKVVRLAQVRLSPETGSSASTGFEKMLEMIPYSKHPQNYLPRGFTH